MSWPEIGDVINRELRPNDPPYDSSAYRKQYSNWKRGYEQIFSKLEGDEYCQNLKEQTRKLEKEKKKLQTEKIEYNRWLREEARNELICEKITEAIEKLNDENPLIIPNPIAGNSNTKDKKGWVLAFGDAHFGAEFEIRGLYGEIINKYSPEIFYERMNELYDEVVDIVKKENIADLYIFDMGDQIDGMLRVSQLMKLRYGVIESSLRYAEWLSNWLSDLSNYCKIHFQTVYGNHSELRMLSQPKGSFDNENMGAVILEFVKIRLKDNPNIKITENASGLIYENLHGYNIVGFHGESKNLEKTLKDFQKLYRTDIDILIAGHLHHSYSETIGIDSDVMRTPSIVGVDDFSMSLYKTSNPGATLFAVEADKGKIMEYNIKFLTGGELDGIS